MPAGRGHVAHIPPARPPVLAPKRDVIDIATAIPAIEVIDPTGWPVADWKVILVEVAHKHACSVLEIRSVRRQQKLVVARHEAMWRMATETSLSLPDIGRRMGGRDHTTIIHGVRRHEERMRAATEAGQGHP